MNFEYFDISLPKGKHLTHICERWAEDRTDGLQYAFFNGAGYESWENIWGIFNQITPRYKDYQFEKYFPLKTFFTEMLQLLKEPQQSYDNMETFCKVAVNGFHTFQSSRIYNQKLLQVNSGMSSKLSGF